MKDEQIIELFFSRSEQAIEETTLKYGRLAKSVSFRIVRNEEDADECVAPLINEINAQRQQGALPELNSRANVNIQIQII